MRLALLAAAAAVLDATPAPSPAPRAPDVDHADGIIPNDNRHPAGRLAGGVLTVALEAREESWYPEGPRGRCFPRAGGSR